MKSIDCGLTETPVVPLREMVRGENPPAVENFHVRSRAVSVCAPDISVPHPLHVTYENIGFRIASTLLRSITGGLMGSAQLGGVPQGTSNERALSSESFGSHERTQRLFASACTWFR